MFPKRAPRKTAERPGELVFNVLWSYVKEMEFSVNCISVRLSHILYYLESTTTADHAGRVKQGVSNHQDRLEQQLNSRICKNNRLVFFFVDETSTSDILTTLCNICMSTRTPTTALTQPSSCLDRRQKRKQKQKHTTAGIRQWSPT
jgi:hypothetical protein